MKIYQNYIGGAWMESLARRNLPNLNPADPDDTIGAVPHSTADEAVAAIEVAAHTLFAWRAVSLPERGAILARVAQLLTERADTIAGALTREQGKLLAEARVELEQAAAYASFCAAAARVTQGVTIPLAAAERVGYTMRRPLGVVLILASYELPLLQPLRHLAAAFMAGNTIVFQPDPHVPETAAALVRCFIDAGAPAGTLNLVYGSADETGTALIEHPSVRAVAVSGPRDTAAAVCRRVAARGVRAHCESPAVNPVIVLEDADLEQALAGVIAEAFANAGQLYGAPKRVILMHPVADAFLEELVARAGRLRPGVDIGPCVDAAGLNLALDLARAAVAQGAELLCGGARVLDGAAAQGFFLRPTVLDRVAPEMRIAQEPAPGPVLAVTRVESFAEALALANHAPVNNAATIYTRDGARMFRFIDAIAAAAASVNAPVAGDEAALPPLEALLDFYSALRTVSIDYGNAR